MPRGALGTCAYTAITSSFSWQMLGAKEEMRRHMVRRLALSDLRKPERLNELAEHQRDLILEWFRRSELDHVPS